MTGDSINVATPSPNPLPQGERASLASPASLTTHHSPFTDLAFLLHATRLAERGLGRTWPNPSVGCVIVKDGAIIAAARTADGGRPHAETQALTMAGEAARGATAYVSLEPCAHHGKTPPCAQALIDAGIARVVIGCEDPDPRTSGKGAAMLQAAGVEVTSPSRGKVDALAAGGGLLPSQPQTPTRPSGDLPPRGGGKLRHDLNRGFFRRIEHGLPYVAIKLATSADYFMARGDGGGQWLTGEFARQHGHLLRAQFDCILTGIGTVLADDPLLTVRAPIAAHPALVRVVADRQLRVPLKSKLVKSANHVPLWLITTPEAVELNASHATELREAGVKMIAISTRAEAKPSPPAGEGWAASPETSWRRGARGRDDCAPNVESPSPSLSPKGRGTTECAKSLTPHTILTTLAAEGITRVLVEAGPTLSAAFLASGLVETLHHYRAPISLGNAGKSPIDALHTTLATAQRTDARALGEDVYEQYEL
jgi:diaminohydroxyphosphoribosylaminopyrimidine deaminase/5-amino-6-(5-phosphoribosylamino)uracil reductase